MTRAEFNIYRKCYIVTYQLKQSLVRKITTRGERDRGKRREISHTRKGEGESWRKERGIKKVNCRVRMSQREIDNYYIITI